MSYFGITGIRAGNQSPRRDVEIWYQEGIQPALYADSAMQLSLFIRGLQRFQDAPPSNNRLSYYRIAGIHGWPKNLPWDGVAPLKENEGFNFCSHGNVTFPTWHRPYLALYEQLIYQHMKDIVTQFIPNEQKYLWNKAADEWRLPYWDYARLPQICTIASLEEIFVRDFGTNVLIPIKNPMYSYRIAGGTRFANMGGELAIGDITANNGSILIPSGMVQGTSRYAIKSPISPTAPWIKGVSDNNAVSAAFRYPRWPSKASGTIAENVYKLLTEDYFKSWRAFSSTKYYSGDQDARRWLSLEALHNMGHIWTGGTNINGEGVGHMTFVEIAAFDPIFWLHHNFVEMILATWQTVTLNRYWFDDQSDPTDPKSTDPLPPFHTPEYFAGTQVMFTSDTVKDYTARFNYRYDILVPRDRHIKADGSVDEKLYSADLAIELNKRYSTTRSEVLAVHDPELIPPNSTPPDYIINVTYDKHILKQPYLIHLYAGEPDQSYPSYSAQPNCLGSIYTFSRTNPIDSCSNCKAQIEEGHLSTGQITITGAMIKDVQNPSITDAGSLDPESIERYLEHHLTWRIVTLTGIVINPEELGGLKITLFVGNGHHYRDDAVLSSYETYRPLFGATSGKAGGASEETGGY